MDQKNRILLLISNIPDALEPIEVYPSERQKEIEACANERVRLEKYYAWSILLSGLSDFLGDDAANVAFYKNENGKWHCNSCSFSLSHSDGVVAVAISQQNVGVDIENVKRHRNGIERVIFSESEQNALFTVDESLRESFIIKKWTQKESVFKTLDKNRFVPSLIDPTEYTVWTEKIDLCDKRFFVSVCADDVTMVDMKII